MADSERVHRLWLAAILLCTLGVYLPSLANDYTYDARHYAMGTTPDGAPNYMVHELRPITEYFKKPMRYRVGEGGRGFRPVTVYSYALMHNLLKPAAGPGHVGPIEAPAWASHLLDLLLHVLATWLVYLLVVEVAGRGPPALVAAAVFGLHALRSDVVLSIVGRAEIFGLLFGALGTLLYLRALQREGVGRRAQQVLALMCMFLSFCSKESAVAWAVFLPLLVWARYVQRDKQRDEQQPFPWGATVERWLWICVLPLACFLILRGLMLAEHLDREFIVGYRQNPLHHVEGPQVFATAVMMLGYGLYKVFLPFHLACDYGAHVFPIVELGDYRFLSAGLVLVAVLALGLWVARRAPLVFLAMASFLGFAFVTSNIPVLAEANFAERFYYTPAVGVSFLAAFAASKLRPGRIRLVALGLLGIWLVVSAGLCFKRSLSWRDNETLFQNDVLAQPRSVSIRMYLSGFARKRGHMKGWKHHLDKALEIDDRSPDPLNSMGAWHIAAGQPQEAIKYLIRGTRSPYYNRRMNGPWIHTNLADAYLALGQVKKAETALEEVLRCDHTRIDALQRVLELIAEAGDRQRLFERLQKGREHLPDAAPLLDMYQGRLAFLHGNYGAAAQLLGRSLPVVDQIWDPADGIEPLVRGWYALARSLLVLDRPAESAPIVQRFLGDPRLQPKERQMFQRLAQDLRRR